ncbi:hypothetical protein ACQJBY_050677 [Aegilops geniculata]
MAAAECGSREERWSLASATALVTGGSKGIVEAIVEELAGFGARVHTCSRNAGELEECRQRWEEKGMRVTVSVPADREKLMDTVRQTFDGKLSILVNNAGQHLVKPTVECTMEEYKNVMATNLESSFHLSQLAHPLLVRAAGGNIINISSIASSIGFAGSTIYTITKGALNQLTGSLATEWAPHNIRLNSVAPGFITTDVVEKINKEYMEREHSKTPLRWCGKPAEVRLDGGISLHAGGSFITGQVIYVDGGRTISA